MKVVAHFFSIVFVPLLIPLFAALLIIWANPYAFGGEQAPEVVAFLYYVALCTFIMPTVGLLMIKQLKLVEDLNLNDQRKRVVPYFLVISCYSIAFYMLNNLSIPTVVKAMMFGSLVSVIISFFWNNFLKVSAHANGMGSLIGVVIGLLFVSTRNIEIVLVVLLLICGAVLSSRLYLGVHTLKEVSIGFILGLVTQLLSFYLFFLMGI